MTGPENIILLNTRTGDTWMFSRAGFNYLPKSPTRPYSVAPDEGD